MDATLSEKIVSEEEAVNELQKQIQLLTMEKEELSKSLSSESSEHTENEEKLEKLRGDLKGLKFNYEKLVWERAEMEKEISKLEFNIELIKKKLIEAHNSKSTTDLLKSKIQNVKDLIIEKSKERVSAEQLKKKLELELAVFKEKLLQQFAKAFEIKQQLVVEKQSLERKLKFRTAIDEILFSLNAEMENLKDQVEREEKLRKETELFLLIEVNELKRRINLEASCTKDLKNKVQRGLTHHQSIGSEIVQLKNKVNDLLEQTSDPIDTPVNLYKERLPEITLMIQSLHERLDVLENEMNTKNDLDNDASLPSKLKSFESTSLEEGKFNSQLETKSLLLEKCIRKLEVELKFEALAYSILEKRYLAEISSLKIKKSQPFCSS